MAEELTREATLGRAHPADAEETQERVAEARAAMAAVLAADLETVALTRGPAHGLAVACALVPWRAGDVAVLVTDGRHTGAWPVEPLRALGVEVTALPAGRDADSTLDAVERAVKGGAQLVGLSHVAESTGQLLPAHRMSGIAHGAGALFVVDAAATIGAIELDLDRLGADVVAFPSERWLLGPVGLGGLWCASERLELLTRLNPDGFGDPLGEGTRGGRSGPPRASGLPAWHRPSVVGFARSCGLLSMQIGLPWAWQRTAKLVSRAVAGLRGVEGVELLTPADPDRTAAIVAFRIGGWEAKAALDELGARIFAIAGLVEASQAIRISPGCWNTEDEIDRFVACVALLAAHRPGTLPPRRTLSVLE
jgi:selenocysteine lyase/cysteine desulfurase